LQSLGLSQKRQSYLYEKIRQFVPDPHKDELCPAPELDPESAADEVHQVPQPPAFDMSVQQGADAAAARLATPKRKAPKCSK